MARSRPRNIGLAQIASLSVIVSSDKDCVKLELAVLRDEAAHGV
jgi:hypothetical protein